MKMDFLRATHRGIAVGVLGAAMCVGQAPLLKLSAPQLGPHGWQLTVTNSYSAPATAYWIDLYGEQTTRSRPLARHWTDAVPGPANYRLAILPGKSRVIAFGNKNKTNIAYTDAAVLYADGATAGNLAIIARFERIRRAELADLTDALNLLTKAQSDGTSRAELAQTFRALATAHAAILKDGLAHADDRVCMSAVANLERTDQDRPTAFQGLRIMFTHWLSQLRASKPFLTQ